MKITSQIKLIGLLLSMLLVFIISSTIYLISSDKEDAQIINIAGRERMLTQLISKELFYALMVKELDNQALHRAKDELRQNLDDLINGNETRKIYTPPTISIDKQLRQIDPLLQRFERAIDLFDEGFEGSLDNYNQLTSMNAELLELSEAVTKMSVRVHAGDVVVDRAGRQRMLTQKMARVVSEFFSMPKLQSYENISGFFVEYGHTLSLFLENRHFRYDNEAMKLLGKNQELFDRYTSLAKKHFNEHMKLVEQSTFVYEFNMVLLDAIDNVVESYARHAISKKEFLERLQLVAGAFALIVVLFAFFAIRAIALQFDRFSQTTQMLHDNEDESRPCNHITELEQASQNIEQFVTKIDHAILHAKRAVLESENAAKELGQLSEELEIVMSEHSSSDESMKNINTYIDRSEDIAIQSAEELHSTSELLDKLHGNLLEIMQQTKSK